LRYSRFEALTLTADRSQLMSPGSLVSLAHRLAIPAIPDVYSVTYANLAGDDYDLASLALTLDLNGNGVADRRACHTEQ